VSLRDAREVDVTDITLIRDFSDAMAHTTAGRGVSRVPQSSGRGRSKRSPGRCATACPTRSLQLRHQPRAAELERALAARLSNGSRVCDAIVWG
jgi:hypothetical protein